MENKNHNVMIVCGPQGSNKYCGKRRGDRIVDADTLLFSLSELPYSADLPVLFIDFPANELLSAVSSRAVRSARSPREYFGPSWLLEVATTKVNGSTEAQVYDITVTCGELGGANVCVLETPDAKCVAQIYEDSMRKVTWKPWVEKAEKWDRDYEPMPNDGVTKARAPNQMPQYSSVILTT